MTSYDRWKLMTPEEDRALHQSDEMRVLGYADDDEIADREQAADEKCDEMMDDRLD